MGREEVRLNVSQLGWVWCVAVNVFRIEDLFCFREFERHGLFGAFDRNSTVEARAVADMAAGAVAGHVNAQPNTVLIIVN